MYFLINIYKKVNFVFNKKYSSYIPFLLLFILLTLLEVLSIGLIIPYMNLIFNPDILMSSFFKNNLNLNKDFNPRSLIIPFSVVFIVVFIFKTFFIIFVRALIQKVFFGKSEKLQIELMQTYQNMDYVEFNKKTVRVHKNIREFSANCMTCLEMGLRVTSEFIIILAIVFFIIFRTNPSYFCWVNNIDKYFTYNFYLKPLAIKWGKEKTEATKLIYRAANDSFKGFKSINSLGKQNFFLNF